MQLTRVGRSTVFRFALGYLALFGISTLLVLGFIYWRTMGYLAVETDALIRADVLDLSEEFYRGGIPAMVAEITERLRQNGENEAFYLLVDRDGQSQAGNLSAWPREVRKVNQWIEFKAPPHHIQARTADLPGGVRLLVGRDFKNVSEVQDTIRTALGWSLSMTLGLGAVGGVLMSLGMVARLDAINRMSRDIVAGDLSRRVPLRGTDDDFDALARNLNSMLDRIQTLMATVKGVSDNIAHDLRTPLARLKARLELARGRPPPPGLYEPWIDDTVADVDAVLDTFEALLQISEIEAGKPRERFAEVDLAAIAADVAEYFEPLAEEKEQILTLATEPVAAVRGDRSLLFRALANVLDNAVKYTPEGGRIALTLRPGPSGPVLTVADTGPGIPPEERERVFRRLYRLESSRTQPGSGLGLSLAAAVAELHGITIRLEDNDPGLKVTLSF